MSAAAGAVSDPQLKSILPPLWLFPSAHWVFAAIVASVAAFSAGPSRLLLALCGFVVAADAAILFVHLGPFIGEAMLAGAALLFFVAAAQKPGA
jgi:hypothetical protein